MTKESKISSDDQFNKVNPNVIEVKLYLKKKNSKILFKYVLFIFLLLLE